MNKRWGRGKVTEYVWQMRFREYDGRCCMHMLDLKDGELVETGWVCVIQLDDDMPRQWRVRQPNGKYMTWGDGGRTLVNTLNYCMDMAQQRCGLPE